MTTEMRMINIESMLIHIDHRVERLEGAERSGVLQGCLPSANCSAGAGADALSDSLISSVVPRETAVGMRLVEVIKSDIGEATRLRDRWIKCNGINNASHFQGKIEALNEVLSYLGNEHSDARQCNVERALARNAKLRDAGESGVEQH